MHSARQLAAAGLTRYRLDEHLSAGRLVRLRRGWYATPDADAAIVAAVSAGGRSTCISALRFHGAWTMPHSGVHVRVASGTAVRPGRDRHLHWTRQRVDLAQPVDDPLTALGVAIECLDLRSAVVVVDSVLNRGIASRHSVEALLASSPRGRRLLVLCDGNAESGIETLARLALRRRRLVVRTQVGIPGIGRVDLLIGDRLVLEVDGRQWHDFEADRARDRALIARGYLVIRASYHQVLEEWDLIEAQILVLVRRREHRWRASLAQGARRRPSGDEGTRGRELGA